MVKGVNKTIIEINNTESEYFEKILLFVKREHTADNKQLDSEVSKIYHTLSNEKFRIPLRRIQQKRRRKILLAVATIIVVAAIAAVIIF